MSDQHNSSSHHKRHHSPYSAVFISEDSQFANKLKQLCPNAKYLSVSKFLTTVATLSSCYFLKFSSIDQSQYYTTDDGNGLIIAHNPEKSKFLEFFHITSDGLEEMLENLNLSLQQPETALQEDTYHN